MGLNYEKGLININLTKHKQKMYRWAPTKAGQILISLSSPKSDFKPEKLRKFIRVEHLT